MARTWPCQGCGRQLTIEEERKHVCTIRMYISFKSGYTFAQCLICLTWPVVDGGSHRCMTRKDGKMEFANRRWDHKLGAWVLADPPPKALPPPAEPVKEEPKPNLFYDFETGQWVDEATFYARNPPPAELQEFTASSCEIPPDHWLKQREKKGKDTNYYKGTGYKFAQPWDKVDRAKYPKTWWVLFLLHHDYRAHGKWVSEEEWQDRINGVYKPKSAYFTNYYQHNYNHQNHHKLPESGPRTESQRKYYEHDYGDGGND